MIKISVKLYLIATLLCLFSSLSYSQNVSENVLKPLLLDRAVLSGNGLKKVELKDTPERDFFQKNIYRGKDLGIYVVSSESWKIPFDKFWFDEFIYMLHGKAQVVAHDEELSLPGRSYIFAPKDFPGSWEVQTGDNYHYELSVITHRRADSTATSSIKKPFVFDQDLLEGVNIEFDKNGQHQKTIADGIELDIFLFAEKPNEEINWTNPTEQMIHILSGQINFEHPDGTKDSFYTGDFFVLPENYKGHRISEGHSIVKYFSVQKTKEL